MALEITNLRFLDQMRGGRAPGAEVSLLKIRGTEIQQALTELMLEAVGPLAQPFQSLHATDFDQQTASIAPRYCNYRKTSIYAGSNENPAQYHRQGVPRAVNRMCKQETAA